eukprot:598426-Prymnesium_polylepis.1
MDPTHTPKCGHTHAGGFAGARTRGREPSRDGRVGNFSRDKMNGPHGAVQSAASWTRVIAAADGTHAVPCSTSMPCNHEQQRTQMPLCISQSCCKHGRSPGF